MRQIVLASVLVCASAWAQSNPAPPAGEELLPPLIPAEVPPPEVNFSEPPDFSVLRDAYARRADFSTRCEINNPTRQFAREYEAKNFPAAAATLLQFLERCPVDAQAHAYAAVALRGAGNGTEADKHRRWFFGLTDSAMKSGDGLTPETPFITISVAEEYAILFRMRRAVVKQILLKFPTLLDALEARDETGDAKTYYFEPSWHFIRLAHQFPRDK